MHNALNDDEQRALQSFCENQNLAKILLQHGSYRTFSKGSLFIEEGDTTSEVFLLLAGTARSYLLSLEGREMWISLYNPGVLIGEMAALTGTARSASIIATSPITCLCFSGDDFKALLADNGPLGLLIAKIESNRLITTTKALFSAAIDPIDNRLLKFLTGIGIKTNADAEAVTIAPLPVITELALQLGSNRETVSRAIDLLP